LKNKISEDLLVAEEAYRNKNYIKSYSIYKSIYKENNLQKIIPRLVDIAYLKLNKTNIKFKIISNLIDIGFKKNDESKILTELVYLKLKLLREFEKFSDFYQFYSSANSEHRNFIFTQFEYFHYLLETENYEEAENILKKIQSANISFLKIIDIFFLDKKFFDQIFNNELDVKHNITFHEENITSNFEYIVIVMGNFEIFQKEIIPFAESLKKTSSNYLLSILINDINKDEFKIIYKKIKNLNIENISIYIENSKNLNLDKSELKAFYTARRFILANDLMEKFSKTLLVFDADTIINKNLADYVALNRNIDIAICIKKSFRYFHLTISANQTMFNNTINSKVFLKFYKKYIYYILNYKKIRWHIDQIVLYIAFIFTKKYFKAKIIDNLNENNYKNKDCFFYHTVHDKYRLVK
tara:strand:+ start:41 stop:1276 length:1236 start_codon:yes stop_codon:yes gene_type:complete